MSVAAVRVCLFDLYGTLLDLESAARPALPGVDDVAGFMRTWRGKQLEYSWTRTLMGRYADFQVVTEEALAWALAAAGIVDRQVHAELRGTYDRLEAYADAAPALHALGDLGLRRGVLSNGTEAMIRTALARTGLAHVVDTVISVDPIGVYKPDPRVYAHAVERLGCRPAEIAFHSSNAWDAAGAAAAGLAVTWVNRAARPDEYGLRRAAHEVHGLGEVLSLVRGERD